MNAVAEIRTVSDLIREYEEKSSQIPTALAQYKEAVGTVEAASGIPGFYAGSPFRYHPDVSEDAMRKLLLVAAWKAVYSRLSIDRVAPSGDKQAFERVIGNPPPLTADNIIATFGDYVMRPRFHILKGMAEIFTKLDPWYKSHSRVKVGVEGLPKRIVTRYRGVIEDVVNALCAYRSQPLMTPGEREAVSQATRDMYFGPTTGEFGLPRVGLRLKRFKNGNVHIHFDGVALHDINAGLAEFYGDVLPDVDVENPEKQPSTAIAKDLQFYFSPEKVVHELMNRAGLYKVDRFSDRALKVLEPSCGDGRIMDAVRTLGHQAQGYEYHAGRCAEARAKGHSAICANFLEVEPREEFDVVVMNPPFYGKHYAKHVEHAFKFLKLGGLLVTVLPATARYDHDILNGEWADLPVASFAEAGTNVPTVILTQYKRVQRQVA